MKAQCEARVSIFIEVVQIHAKCRSVCCRGSIEAGSFYQWRSCSGSRLGVDVSQLEMVLIMVVVVVLILYSLVLVVFVCIRIHLDWLVIGHDKPAMVTSLLTSKLGRALRCSLKLRRNPCTVDCKREAKTEYRSGAW